MDGSLSIQQVGDRWSVAYVSHPGGRAWSPYVRRDYEGVAGLLREWYIPPAVIEQTLEDLARDGHALVPHVVVFP